MSLWVYYSVIYSQLLLCISVDILEVHSRFVPCESWSFHENLEGMIVWSPVFKHTTSAVCTHLCQEALPKVKCLCQSVRKGCAATCNSCHSEGCHFIRASKRFRAQCSSSTWEMNLHLSLPEQHVATAAVVKSHSSKLTSPCLEEEKEI